MNFRTQVALGDRENACFDPLKGTRNDMRKQEDAKEDCKKWQGCGYFRDFRGASVP